MKHHWPNSEARWPNDDLEIRFTGIAVLKIREINSLHKGLWLKNKRSGDLLLCPCRWRLGTDTDDSRRAKVNTPKNKKDAPAAESANKRRKRTKHKLIPLDDLLPKQDVKGGHQVIFGAPDKTQTTNNLK